MAGVDIIAMAGAGTVGTAGAVTVIMDGARAITVGATITITGIATAVTIASSKKSSSGLVRWGFFLVSHRTNPSLSRA